MVIKYYHPYWGMEHLPMENFLKKICSSGFDGAEIALDPDKDDLDHIRELFDGYGLDLLVQHPFAKGRTPGEHLTDYLYKLERLIHMQPVKINCHTGKDYYSMEENAPFIEGAAHLAKKYGVRVSHEIHRGRFSFCPSLISGYLSAFPDLALTADFSHWCVVSESLLEDQQETMDRVFPHCTYIHARVGFAQGPQVPNPAAPEYAWALQTHLQWWQRILEHHKDKERTELTITCEFGPPPYMPCLPFSRQPIGSQYEMNVFVKNYLSQHLIV
jgi:sugar phosphate isomerase/epimerase